MELHGWFCRLGSWKHFAEGQFVWSWTAIGGFWAPSQIPGLWKSAVGRWFGSVKRDRSWLP